MLTKDMSSSKIATSPKMGSSNWQPTMPTYEKPFMTATIMSSEKVRSKSPQNNIHAQDLTKEPKDNINKELISHKSKSPIVERAVNHINDKHKSNSTIDRLAMPKNRTEPYKSKNTNGKENSRSKSPNENQSNKNLNKSLHDKHNSLKNKMHNHNVQNKSNEDVKVEIYYKNKSPQVYDDFKELENLNSKYDNYDKMKLDNNN
jgi:hypothetical protein